MCIQNIANIFAGFWICACWICAKSAKIDIPRIFPLLQYGISSTIGHPISQVSSLDSGVLEGVCVKSLKARFGNALYMFELNFSNYISYWVMSNDCIGTTIPWTNTTEIRFRVTVGFSVRVRDLCSVIKLGLWVGVGWGSGGNWPKTSMTYNYIWHLYRMPLVRVCICKIFYEILSKCWKIGHCKICEKLECVYYITKW